MLSCQNDKLSRCLDVSQVVEMSIKLSDVEISRCQSSCRDVKLSGCRVVK